MAAKQTGPAGNSLSYSEFSEPRLVAVYDTICPIAEYETFYVELARRLRATTIIDLGCGTGLLTAALAARGHRLIGVEPAPLMLERARSRPDAGHIRWVAGGASALGACTADLAIMTGHVAQFFLEDADWQATLRSLHGALRPGGHLAFESRNPLVQPWFNPRLAAHADWPSATSPRRVDDPAAGPVKWWSERVGVAGERVRYNLHYRFLRTGDELVAASELRFRPRAALERSLAEAGFTVQAVHGDWDGRPADDASPEMIVVAVRS